MVVSVFLKSMANHTIDIENKEFSKYTQRSKSDDNNSDQIGSPLPGQVAKIFVEAGNKVITR